MAGFRRKVPEEDQSPRLLAPSRGLFRRMAAELDEQAVHANAKCELIIIRLPVGRAPYRNVASGASLSERTTTRIAGDKNETPAIFTPTVNCHIQKALHNKNLGSSYCASICT